MVIVKPNGNQSVPITNCTARSILIHLIRPKLIWRFDRIRTKSIQKKLVSVFDVRPSQAVAYKIGALTILRLKKKSQEELGKKLDPREFHDQVLNTGAPPLAVLEKKINDWIAS